jgi:5-formyltetrahydrofolate cyclo-ligase
MKEYLRKDLLKKRNNLSNLEVIKKSSHIKKRLFNMNEYKKSQTIFYYISYDNEVYTHDMIKKSILDNKNIVVPVSDKINRKLILSKLDKWDDLEIGSYNVLEPKKKCIKKTSIDKIDLILVPGVGFDIKGNRIGHGMGYFDKLLKDSNYLDHIGLAFELQIIDFIPTEKHDISVNKIITENRIINCINL